MRCVLSGALSDDAYVTADARGSAVQSTIIRDIPGFAAPGLPSDGTDRKQRRLSF